VSLAQTFTDAEGAVMRWVNAQTTDLVGVGHPLPKGAHVNRLRGAAAACYAWLSQVGGSTSFGVENADQRARISAQIYGPTKEAAAAAAVAYANAVAALGGAPAAVPGAVLLAADNVTGPLWAPDFDEPRYLVDADFYLRPA
jgi:predicted Na+-dependent transporter